MNTMEQMISNSLTIAKLTGQTKVYLTGSLWLIIVNDDIAHIVSNGNVYGIVKI